MLCTIISINGYCTILYSTWLRLISTRTFSISSRSPVATLEGISALKETAFHSRS